MRLKIQPSDWVGPAAALARFTMKRGTIPILSAVRLEAKEGRISATATDMECAIHLTLPGIILQDGVACVDAAWLHGAAGAVGSGEALLEETEGRLIMSAQDWDFSTRRITFDAADFPSKIPEADIQLVAGTTAGAMLRALEAARRCISTEETRYYLNGIYVTPEGENDVRLVSTDGHRLISVLMQLDTPRWVTKPAPAGGIIPRPTILRVIALLRGMKAEAAVTLRMTETKATFVLGSITVRSKLIDGTFPEWRKVVPPAAEANVIAVKDSQALLKLLKAAGRCASEERSRPVKLMAKGGALSISGDNFDVDGAGGFTMTVPTEVAKVAAGYGDRMLGLQARYLAEMLVIAGSRICTMSQEHNDQSQASPVRIDMGGDFAPLMVLMPMRV